MSTTYSKNFFQRKSKLVKEIYNLKQFISKNIIFKCEIETLSPADKVKSFHWEQCLNLTLQTSIDLIIRTNQNISPQSLNLKNSIATIYQSHICN